MAKQSLTKRKGGYALLEMVFVMLALSIITTTLVISSLDLYHRYTLLQTTRKISILLLHTQNDSMFYHRRNLLEFKEYSVQTKEDNFAYFGEVTLDSAKKLSFNEHGHSSSAMTLVFSTHGYEQSIVVWLGGGFFERKTIKKRHGSD